MSDEKPNEKLTIDDILAILNTDGLKKYVHDNLENTPSYLVDRGVKDFIKYVKRPDLYAVARDFNRNIAALNQSDERNSLIDSSAPDLAGDEINKYRLDVITLAASLKYISKAAEIDINPNKLFKGFSKKSLKNDIIDRYSMIAMECTGIDYEETFKLMKTGVEYHIGAYNVKRK